MLIASSRKDYNFIYLSQNKMCGINFTGLEKPKTSSFPSEKIVQFFGAASAIPTSLTLPDIETLQTSLLDKSANETFIAQSLIRVEKNRETIELLRKVPHEKIDLTLRRMHDYALAQQIASVIAEEGYGILTGDSTGAMEAAKKGAKQKGGYCVGVGLKGERLIEDNLDEFYIENTWHTRLDRFNERGKGPFTIVMPGGEGSISKLWDKLVHNILEMRNDTKKGVPKQVILVDKEYWQPMINWLGGEPSKRGYIRSLDNDILKLINTPEELRTIISKLK